MPKQQARNTSSGKLLTPALFYGAIILHLIAILAPYAFVTHDGPSHLYNAHIINEILFSNHSIYKTYHIFNPNWAQPNLIGYIILCFLQLILPFLWAEKILIAVYVLTIVFGFRFFLRQISSSSEWYSLMIFPFIFSAILFWGFYNFLIGLALCFWFLGLYEKYKKKLGYFQILMLTALSIIIFYSHALIFILSALYISISIVIEFIEKKWNKSSLLLFVKSSLLFLPGMSLFLIYLYQNKTSSFSYEEGYSVINRLSQLWLNIGSIAFTGYAEGNYLKTLYAVIFTLTIVKIVYYFKRKEQIFTSSFSFFMTFFLIMLFVPNSGAGGGIIILRLNLIFFLFWIVWISSQSITKYSKYLILGFYIISLPLLYLRWQVIESCAFQCKNAIQLSENIIPSYSVLSTIHYIPVRHYVGKYQVHSYIDITGNIDNYIAIMNNAVTLHNYEANSPYMGSNFPIIWKEWKSTDFVWRKISINESIEYFNLTEFEQKWESKPQFLLSFGSFEHTEKEKSIWDTENNYALVKADSINFFNIYKLNK